MIEPGGQQGWYMLTAVGQDRTGIVLQVKNIKGDAMTYHCDGFESRAVQHELDHLDGLLFLDRLVSTHELFRHKTYPRG